MRAADPEPQPRPDRADWPEAPPHTEAGAALTELILATFRLNDRLMAAAQTLAAAGGMTAAWWQVLGGVLDRPRTVAEIGRLMGMSRQGVQRIADVLVERGLADYQPNPAHRRAKLLACTEAGYFSIRQITVRQHPWTDGIGSSIGADDLRHTLATMNHLVEILDTAADSADERSQLN